MCRHHHLWVRTLYEEPMNNAEMGGGVGALRSNKQPPCWAYPWSTIVHHHTLGEHS